jgi:alcohol dehydrogenase (cytochrome c)
MTQPPDDPRNPLWILAIGMACFFAAAAAVMAVPRPDPSGSAQVLVETPQDDVNWLLPARTYAGNRYTPLTQIDKANVGSLSMAWSTAVADDGEQEAAPIVANGVMYVSTPHDGVLALDASTGKLRWQAPYNPRYVLLYAVNRGVGLADGKVFIATQDCRLIALEAATGRRLWNVQGCRDTSNSFYSMAAYVYKDQIILGTGGGDDGTLGLVSAFRVKDGHRLWDWQTIPGPGQRGHSTWPCDSWKHGGGAVWSGVALDEANATLFVAPGNPGPDLVIKGRKGENLYTDSLVALDISGAQPRMKWYYKILENDSHDDDPAMIPVLFEGVVGGHPRRLVAVGDKASNFVLLDRDSGRVVHRLAVGSQAGLDTVPTRSGTRACPNHGGGIEWNGGAYDPNSNSFLVPSTEECAVWTVSTDDPQYIPGQPYTGGPLPKRQKATGVLTSIDVNTGKVRWRNTLPYAAEGGVLITASGLAFTSDVGGNIYAFDAASGHQYWKDSTGSAVVAPISAYRLNGGEYLATVVGEAGNQQTPNLPPSRGSKVITYRLNVVAPITNGTVGQVPQADVPTGTGDGSAETATASSGIAPYTQQQVAQGAKVYADQCANCHGANLQGLSAPALTGPGFGHSHLNAAQLRSVVTQQMPLTAPSSLKPDEYAAVMAFMLSYDCVQPAGNGRQPFPTTPSPALQQVQLGSTTCAPKGH